MKDPITNREICERCWNGSHDGCLHTFYGAESEGRRKVSLCDCACGDKPETNLGHRKRAKIPQAKLHMPEGMQV